MRNGLWLVLLILIAATSTTCASGKLPEPMGCCITDPTHFWNDSEVNIRRRFDLYKSAGIDTIRTGAEWRDLEGEKEGQWKNDALLRYFKLIKEYNFRVKFIVGVLQGPPGWFLDQHPDAQITDENGGHSRNTVSFWYPNLHRVVDEKTRGIFEFLKKAGIAENVVEVIPSFGPAGEPIYPVPWTLGPKFPNQTYWCYDEHAQADFRARMRGKYGTVDAANRAWGTKFASWDDVKVLKPGEQPGTYWNDVLTWYRDTKRSFIEWQIDHLRKYAGRGAKVVLYIPGTAYTRQEWDEAVRTAKGSDNIKAMSDSMFLIDIAAKKRCWLQYTGCENGPEVERLCDYLDEHGYKGIEMWGENAGNSYAAGDPLHLADVITQNKLWGLDYTHAHYAFEKDGVTPNPKVWPLLKQAYERVREMHQR